jgi:Cdc6-like AAA superfamily ATPase
MKTLNEWFGLVVGRDNFSIESVDDRQHLFARTECDKKISGILDKAFRSNRTTKAVLFGDWGVGKTHTMRHLEYLIENNDEYTGKTVFVELPDILKKSTFQVAHSALLDATGMQNIVTWLFKFQTLHQQKTVEEIQAFTQSSDIATAFMALLNPGNAQAISWKWLRGDAITSGDASSVGLSTHLSQSSQMSLVLRFVGRLCKDASGDSLILMLDECTNIRNVNDADSIGHWKNAFKNLFDPDNKEVGLIISVTDNDPDNFPEPISDQQIRTRIGNSNFITLNRFDREENEEFVKAVLLVALDRAKVDTLIEKYGAEGAGENIDKTTFPFTVDGFNEFLNYSEQHEQAVPRDTLEFLDEIVNAAIVNEKRIITSSFVSSICMG